MSNLARWLRLFQQHAGQPCWEVRAKEDDPEIGELLIYGPIFSEQLYPDEIAPKQVAKELDALGPIKQLHVYINSPGGDAFAGLTINNILRRQKAEVIVHVDGMAASAASIIAMGGDRIIMPANSLMFIHDAWTLAIGNAAELRQVADDLDTLKGALVASYMQHATVDSDEIAALMSAETWLTPAEALELGLATEIEEQQAVAAFVRGDLLVVNGREWDIHLYGTRPPLKDESGNETPVASVGRQVTATQLQHAMAKALGLELVDAGDEEHGAHGSRGDRERMALELQVLKLKEVID